MIRCHLQKNMSGRISSMRDEILSIKLSDSTKYHLAYPLACDSCDVFAKIITILDLE